MVELSGHNPEFAEAWDDLRRRLKEPGFNLEAYLSERSPALSPETVKELRVTIGLRGLYRLQEDYSIWRLKEESKENWKNGLSTRTYRSGWAVAAALLLVLLITQTTSTLIVKGRPAKKSGLVPVLSDLFLPQAVYAAENLFGVPVGTDPIGTFRTISSKGNFKYADLDGDGKMDFVFAHEGHVYRFGLDGLARWHYELTQDKLDEDVKVKLTDTARFQRDMARLTPSLSPSNGLYPWGSLSEQPTLDEAWPLLKVDLSILDVTDFDGDGNQEVLLWFHGCVIVLDSELQQQKYDIEGNGSQRQEIVILDGTRQDAPKAIADLNGDGKKEFIVYRMPGYPQGADGKPIRMTLPDGSTGYLSDGQNPLNSRGLYVTDHYGREKWHLNLPYHCSNVEVGDKDNEGFVEFTLDLTLPSNNYWVEYSPETEGKIGPNFDWPTFPQNIHYLKDLHDPGQLPDTGANIKDLAFIVFGTNGETGRIKYFQPVEGPSFNRFLAGRYTGESGSKEFECMQYAIDWDNEWKNEIGWWYSPGKYDNLSHKLVQYPIVPGGYPDMYNSLHSGIFGFDTSEGPRRVFGLNRAGQIKLTDADYKEIATYVANPDENGTRIPWSYRSCDAMVFDVGDLDGDGMKEILAGFGDFHSLPADPDRGYYSILKILTQDLKPFHPELDWDTFVVQGPITEAHFVHVNNDDQMDIIIMSDFVYFLTPQGWVY